MQNKSVQYDDFKYVIQDTGCVYFGRELRYTEMMERDDVPFKFKAIINGHIAKEADLGQTISAHLMTLDTQSFTFRIFEQLKLAVRVCYQEQKRGLSGKTKEKWVHKTCTVRQFCTQYRDKVEAQQMMIEDISISKLALMVMNI